MPSAGTLVALHVLASVTRLGHFSLGLQFWSGSFELTIFGVVPSGHCVRQELLCCTGPVLACFVGALVVPCFAGLEGCFFLDSAS